MGTGERARYPSESKAEGRGKGEPATAAESLFGIDPLPLFDR